MLTEIPVEVAVVVAEVGPLQFTHRELRSEAEGSFSSVGLGNETLEGFPGDDEHHFVGSVHPCRVAALTESVGDRSPDDGVDENEIARSVKSGRPERLLVDAERESTIALELVTSDGLFAEFEGTSGQTDQVFLDVCVVTEVFDLVGRCHDLEELSIRSSEGFGEHLLAEERADFVEGLEVHGTIRQNGSELRVDLLHIASQVLAEGLAVVHSELDARLNQVLIADVSIDELKDGFLQRDLGLQIGTFERSPGLLDAHARTSTTKGLELELILGRSDLVGSSTNATKGGVIHELRRGKRGGRHCHLFHNGAHDVGDVREGSAINRVDVWRFASEYTTDLADDAVHVFRREVLNSSE